MFQLSKRKEKKRKNEKIKKTKKQKKIRKKRKTKKKFEKKKLNFFLKNRKSYFDPIYKPLLILPQQHGSISVEKTES